MIFLENKVERKGYIVTYRSLTDLDQYEHIAHFFSELRRSIGFVIVNCYCFHFKYPKIIIIQFHIFFLIIADSYFNIFYLTFMIKIQIISVFCFNLIKIKKIETPQSGSSIHSVSPRSTYAPPL